MSYGPFTPSMFASSGVAGTPLSGTTTETTFFSKTLKAGMMGPNDYLDVFTRVSYANSATTKTLRVKIGTTAYVAVAGSTTVSFTRHVSIINRNSTSAQVTFAANQTTDLGITTTALNTYTEDTSVDKTFAITGQLNSAAGTPAMTLESFYVILWKASIN